MTTACSEAGKYEYVKKKKAGAQQQETGAQQEETEPRLH